MQQVSDTCTATYEVKRSTFTSYLVPYPLFERTLQELREAHPKASHIVHAYRYLNSYDQIVEYSTDDGEPKGCAGNPTLAQLRGANLINTALLTVRYFGGIKLGTGGMVRAYSEAAKQVIEEAERIPYIKRNPLRLESSFALIKRYEHFFKTEGIDSTKREFTQVGVVWYLELSAKEKEKLANFEALLL